MIASTIINPYVERAPAEFFLGDRKALQAYKKDQHIHYVNPRFLFIGYVFTRPFIMFPEDYTPIFFKVSVYEFLRSRNITLIDMLMIIGYSDDALQAAPHTADNSGHQDLRPEVLLRLQPRKLLCSAAPPPNFSSRFTARLQSFA